ncbi:MAG: hypothetical protein LBQ06_03700 [Frankiaceae bacterium]|jgi:predicted metal-dependent HD superfamily phosphohydrolase|nr:hypothetical protein [Frankiaceae bacterium]
MKGGAAVAKDDLAGEWVRAAAELGAEPGAAGADGRWLAAQDASPARRYHGTAHIAAVLRGIGELAEALGLTGRQLAIARAAGCAHDVIYTGAAGADEAASARWAREALRGAGADADAADEVGAIILATAEHRGSTPAAWAVLDADLSILATGPADYEAYRRAVRAEYAQLDDERWRAGRTAVLRSLLARDRLYLSAAGRDRWEAAARRNIAAELAALSRPH